MSERSRRLKAFLTTLLEDVVRNDGQFSERVSIELEGLRVRVITGDRVAFKTDFVGDIDGWCRTRKMLDDLKRVIDEENK